MSLPEIKLAKTVFGDSIDYSKIDIQSKSERNILGIIGTCQKNAITLGNAISLGDHAYWNGLHDTGLDPWNLLMHELTHVWQYQNEGLGYIVKSALEQLLEGQKKAYQYSGASGKRVEEQCKMAV
jgi:hypothetical protein